MNGSPRRCWHLGESWLMRKIVYSTRFWVCNQGFDRPVCLCVRDGGNQNFSVVSLLNTLEKRRTKKLHADDDNERYPLLGNKTTISQWKQWPASLIAKIWAMFFLTREPENPTRCSSVIYSWRRQQANRQPMTTPRKVVRGKFPHHGHVRKCAAAAVHEAFFSIYIRCWWFL